MTMGLPYGKHVVLLRDPIDSLGIGRDLERALSLYCTAVAIGV